MDLTTCYMQFLLLLKIHDTVFVSLKKELKKGAPLAPYCAGAVFLD